MSLYVGNLTPAVRLDELERVFQRFGRCSVRMKDGYGFVVYDFPPNAERALRALRDKYICGEELTLTWSNRQPGAFRRAGRGGVSYEMRRGWDGMRDGGFRERVAGRGDMEGRGQNRGVVASVVGEGLSGREDVHEDEDGEPRRVMDDDRWGAQFGGVLNGVATENEGDVVRYESIQDNGRNDDADEKGVHPSSRENIGGGHAREYEINRSNRAKAKQGCYQCGAVGHKIRDCHRRKFPGSKLYRFDKSHVEENKRKYMGRVDIERSGSKKRPRYSWESGPVDREMSGGKSPHSLQHRRSKREGRSLARNEANELKKNECEGKNRGRKREKSSGSSRLDADMSKSNSMSHSSNHKRGYYSHSRSRSVSSRTNSSSSSSRSSLSKRNCRSNGLKSKSRSVSATVSPLSVSTGKPLACSPNIAERTTKIFPDDAVDPEINKALTEQARMVEVGVFSEDAKHESFTEATDDELEALPSKMDKMERYGLEEKTKNNEKVPGSAVEEARESIDPDDDTFVDAGNSLEQRLAATSNVKNYDAIINNDFETLPSKLDRMEEDVPPEENIENYEIELGLADEVARESRDPGEDMFIDAGNSLEQRLSGTKDFLVCDGLKTVDPSHLPIIIKDCDTSYINPSTNISSEELKMILKHYGLGILDENRIDLYPEDYFGAGRLWPWDVVYYRRLKKGLITMQNYARRVVQNREFGITDRYIRSSSGWGELVQENV